MKTKLLLILPILFFTGCVGLGGSSTEKQTDTVKTGLKTQGEMVELSPLVQGNNNNITIPEGALQSKRKFETDSSSDMQSKYSYLVQGSVGLNIFLLGLGLYLLYSLGKKSKIISMTSGLLDNAGASAIAMATNATDSRDIASANHFRAELESLRRHL